MNETRRSAVALWPIAAGVALAILLAGCGTLVPAQVPPQLTHTPGPPVIVTDNEVRLTAFQARYPRGWQVITGPALGDPWVIFVNPDQTALIVLATNPADTEVSPPAAGDNVCRLQQSVQLGGSPPQTISAALAADSNCDNHLPTFAHILESLQPGTRINEP